MARKKEPPYITYSIVTLFPKMFDGFLSESIIGRAVEEKLILVDLYDLREFADDPNAVDDKPYGGGPGMVFKPEPIFKAIEEIRESYYKDHPEKHHTHVILLTPKGRKYSHRITNKLTGIHHVILICGRYEGVDHRVFEHAVDERLSIGDYILTGGELGAMVIIDSVSRQFKGVINKKRSRQDESFEYTEQGYLSPPVYTRPEKFRDYEVPDILLSGNHQEVEKWRKDQAEELTKEMRPDLHGRDTGYF